MKPLPKRVYVCYRNPEDPAEGMAVSADFTDLFDKDFVGQQTVGQFDLKSMQEIVLVPEQIVLKTLETPPES